MRYLLDTNILSDLVRNPQGQVASKIASVGADAVSTSIVVAAELRYRAAKRRSKRLATQLEAILGALEVHAFDAPADETYAHVRVALEAKETPIGANDLLIAAQALTLDLTVVTDNTKVFRRVRGLKLENWMR